MTNKKFSIRKLAVGTASVAIGLSTAGTINSASAIDNNSSEIVGNVSNSETSGSTLEQAKEDALKAMMLHSHNIHFWEDFEYNWRNPIKKAKTKEEISSILKSFYVMQGISEINAEKEKAILEIQKYNFSVHGAETALVSEYKSRINNAQTKNEIDTILQNFKAQLPNELNLFISNLKNLTQEDLKELNLTVESNKQMRNKAIILNELHKIKDLDKEIFAKYKTEIITSASIGDYDVEREIGEFIHRVEIEQARKKLTKRVYDADFLSNGLKSKIINYANEMSVFEDINVLTYSFDTLEKLSKNSDISESKKESLAKELVDSIENNDGINRHSRLYHLLSVIRSLNEQYEIKNNINNESTPKENKTTPEYELSLSNKKVIAYDFLKGLTYPTLEKLRADIINATEEDIYSLSHKASAIKQISSIKNLNNNDKEKYINEILEADLRSDLSTIIGKVLEIDVIETSNLSDKHKNRLKEILNALSQTNYNTFSDIISATLALNESKDLSEQEKEAFFDEFINKYTSPNNQATPSLDYKTFYETLLKMDVSILINKLSYLTDEDKKLYKEKVFAQNPGVGFAGGQELEYRIGFFSKDAILNNSEYTLESIKEFDSYKEAVAKNEELRKKKESEPTFDSKTENADIPFETIYKDDNTLDKGTEVTETEGINGTKEINTTYTVINSVRQDNPKVEEKITKEKVDKVVRRGTKVTSSETEKSTQNIPFETIYKDDNSLDKGKEATETEGINGVKEINTTYTIINGVRQDNPKVEEKITKEKVDKVVRRGTKVSTTTTPELPNNTNKLISSGTNDSKPNTVTPADKPVNSSTNDSKPNIVAPADKPVNSSTNDSKPNTVIPTDKPVNSSTDNNKPNIVAPTVKPAVDNSKTTLANITLENINNDISVTLATAETGVKLVTDEITNPTTLNEVKEKITNENNSITSTTDITNLRVVDLTLEKEGKKYSTNANRTVRIALLNNEKGNEILVYHVKDNGELEELTKEKNNLTITNDSVEFTINHFSKFAIASIKKNIPTPSTNTSEEHNKNKDTRRDLTDIKPSESNQNKILPRTGVSSSSTVLLGATLLSLALISRKLKKN